MDGVWIICIYCYGNMVFLSLSKWWVVWSDFWMWKHCIPGINLNWSWYSIIFCVIVWLDLLIFGKDFMSKFTSDLGLWLLLPGFWSQSNIGPMKQTGRHILLSKVLCRMGVISCLNDWQNLLRKHLDPEFFEVFTCAVQGSADFEVWLLLRKISVAGKPTSY